VSGRLVIMGSGETAPTMVEVHKSVLRAAGEGPALLLDTPYGFQENADEITRRAVDYFGRNVQRAITPLRWRGAMSGSELDRAVAAVRGAAMVFAGPGSPTYALRMWSGTGLAEALVAMVRGGGTVTFASAAALTLGVSAIPVYEIYKCGVDPYWAPGMDVLGELTGLRAALIPHYDNTEGGTHSTRFCYLGERRLRGLEPALPEGAHVIGVDEHTAVVFDLAAGTAEVLGNGVVTVRNDGRSRTVAAGSVVPIAELGRVDGQGAGSAAADTPTSGGDAAPSAERPEGAPTSLRAAADRARAGFDAALAAADAAAAAEAVLTLEQAIHDWAADTLQSDDAEHARRTLRGMVLELATRAESGIADPRSVLSPLVDVVLERREAARRERDFALADELRDRLAESGVLVRDTSRGPEWALRGD
jgi:cyanophycinase-like exopeptidase